jgi:hypothetical protein
MMNEDRMHQPELIRQLLKPAAYPHGVRGLQVIETYTSLQKDMGVHAFIPRVYLSLRQLSDRKTGRPATSISQVLMAEMTSRTPATR